MDDGDLEGLNRHLSDHPGLARQRVHFDGENYFTDPTLLEFAADNPVRHGSLPPNIVAVARTILDAGASADRAAIDSTLALVCSGRVPREAGVQVPLIELLCDYAVAKRALHFRQRHWRNGISPSLWRRNTDTSTSCVCWRRSAIEAYLRERNTP